MKLIYKWSEYNESWGKNFGRNDSEIGIHVPILYSTVQSILITYLS